LESSLLNACYWIPDILLTTSFVRVETMALCGRSVAAEIS